MAIPKIYCVIGTRPEAIKMAPVVLELRKYSDLVETTLISTGQHREMLTQALKVFGLTPDIDLNLMQHGQTLAEVTAKVLTGLDHLFEKERPAFVIGQGDTTTCFGASLAAFYRHVPFAHVEAGLRTPSVHMPFPEEFDRRATSLITAIHFAPTEWAKQNLRKESVKDSAIHVTGNTGIDAVLLAAKVGSSVFTPDPGKRLILLTTHRRENWGAPQIAIATAVRKLIATHEDIQVVVALHRNPAVRETLHAVLDDVPRVSMIEPPDYEDFVHLMKQCTLILTDSGGVQEEAPAFGVPVLVLREETERPEGVHAGTTKLVGTNGDNVFDAANLLLSKEVERRKMTMSVSPYGDGRASERVRYELLRLMHISTPKVEALGR